MKNSSPLRYSGSWFLATALAVIFTTVVGLLIVTGNKDIKTILWFSISITAVLLFRPLVVGRKTKKSGLLDTVRTEKKLYWVRDVWNTIVFAACSIALLSSVLYGNTRRLYLRSVPRKWARLTIECMVVTFSISIALMELVPEANNVYSLVLDSALVSAFIILLRLQKKRPEGKATHTW